MSKSLSKHTLETDLLPFEQDRNTILEAVYDKNYSAIESVLSNCLTNLSTQKHIDETSEKFINQILVILKKFNFIKPESHTISLSHKKIRALLVSNLRKQVFSPDHICLEKWKNKLNLLPEQYSLIYQTAMTFQLTTGCSHFCRRCNEWALAGIRSHFSFNAIKNILKKMAEQGNNEISLYGASDPLDWEENSHCITDIVDFIEELPIDYSLLSKVPKGKQTVLSDLLKQNANLSVSVTKKNQARIQAFESESHQSLFKQHDSDDLLIEAGLDENFTSVKPSITDGYGCEITPDGAFIIIPTFTSALHPFGHKKIPITKQTTFFPYKKTGRHALLIDYFKPLKGCDLDGMPCHLDGLLDVQIESILLDTGEDELTPPGMRSLREYFSIFDETARLQRKKMTPSVFKRLKKQFFKNRSYKQLDNQTKAAFKTQINAHLFLCKKDNCDKARLNAISFFFEQITNYIQTHPHRIKIIKFLIRNELDNLKADSIPTSLEKILLQPDPDGFNLFRKSICCLLKKPEKTDFIHDFINTYPSVYDPDIDFFIPPANKPTRHRLTT